MPGEPTPDQSALSPDLSNFAVQAYYLNPNFAANKIAPVVPVDKVVGNFFRFLPIEGKNVQHEVKIGHGGVAPEMNFVIEKDNYDCEEIGKRHLVTDRELRNADMPARDYIKGDAMILHELALYREAQLATMALTAGNHFSGHWLSVVAAWDTDDADPKEDIDAAMRLIELDSGYTANTLFLPPKSHDIFTRNAEVKELIKYLGGLDFLKTGQVPGNTVFNLELVRAGQTYDENAPLEGSSLAYLWETLGAAGDDWAAILYVDPNPSIRSGGAFAQFAFNSNQISENDIMRFFTYREEARQGEWREARSDVDNVFTNPRAIVILTGLETEGSS